MMRKNLSSIGDRRALRGTSLVPFVPYRSMVDPAVVLTRHGDLVGSWRIEGVDCSTASLSVAADFHESLCQVVQAAARERVGFWVHRIRRSYKSAHHESAKAADDALRAIYRSYQDQLGHAGLFNTEIYLSAVMRPEHPGKRDPAQLQSALEKFRAAARLIESGLQRFSPTRLGLEERRGRRFSTQLQLYGYLLNGIEEPVPVPWGDIAATLATSQLVFFEQHLQALGANVTRHAVVLDLKEYPPATAPGMLDDVLCGPHDIIETQSFLPMTRWDAERFLNRQRNQLTSAGDASVSQIRQIGDALDGVASHDFVLGEYHFSAAVLAKSREEALTGIAALRGRLNDTGFQSAVVDLVPDLAWFAQLPGNVTFRPRSARLSSRNFCALAPLHRHARGKEHGNPWGDAVVVLSGQNQSPVYFNFHVTPRELDSTTDKAPGNTLIVGQTGSGKTVLELFLLAHAMKFSPRLMLFDKDRSSELAMLAFGARYTVFEHGRPTGINPLQWIPDAKNMAFMLRWISSLLEPERRLDAGAANALARAIATVCSFPVEQRRLSVVHQNIPIHEVDLRRQLERWCGNGTYAWAFDQDARVDHLVADRVGYDLTAFFPAAELLLPVMLALLEQLEQWLDGTPFIYVITECWKALDDPLFSAFVRDKQKTIRKQNGLGIFDTQSPRDLLASQHSAALIEQTATIILLPNPSGSKEEYCDGLKLSESEFELLRSFAPGDRRFLIKQGPTCLVAALDLGTSPEILTLLSSNTATVRLCEQLREVHGEVFENWWPALLSHLAKLKEARP